MHTFEFNGPAGQARIHHNGDFSGNAIINVPDSEGAPTGIEVPCEALLAFAAEYVRSRKINALEQAGHREILQGHFV